jgi:hypothetical protein
LLTPATLALATLAGSERTGQAGAKGGQFKEGVAINKSLSALGAVINALAGGPMGDGAGFVPYRNSKLTRVLQVRRDNNNIIHDNNNNNNNNNNIFVQGWLTCLLPCIAL